MQFVGIGIWELLLIMVITVLVVGPERLPEVAAQLARWIRQARAYANVVARDFREVVGDLEKEVGASREDLDEIASVLRRDTRSITEELDRAGRDLKQASDIEGAAGTSVIPLSGNGVTNGTAATATGTAAETEPAEEDSTAYKERRMAEAMAEPKAEAESPKAEDEGEWFQPTSSRRRRRAGDSE